MGFLRRRLCRDIRVALGFDETYGEAPGAYFETDPEVRWFRTLCIETMAESKKACKVCLRPKAVFSARITVQDAGVSLSRH